MGYDTSFHPVDVRLIETRLLPYLAGSEDDHSIDDLVAQAVSLRMVRFRAKAWGLGIANVVPREDFLPTLYVWGRPFLIINDSAEGVAQDVRRWCQATPDTTDALAAEMMRRLDPTLVDRVTPDSATMPDSKYIAEELTWRLRLLRAAIAAHRAGLDEVKDPDSDRVHRPINLIQREIPFSVLEFAATLTPGWMSRGVWPTQLAEEYNFALPQMTAPNPLFETLEAQFPDFDWFSYPCIVENYMVGGYIAPNDVAPSRTVLSTAGVAIPEEEDLSLDFQKLDEAMALAIQLDMGFCEATEIYSGFEGKLN